MSDQVLQDVSKLKLPVDPEPAGLRLVLVGVLIGGFIVTYTLTNAIFGLNTCNLVSVFAGLMIGSGLMYGTEQFLKPRWKSNRFVQLSFTSFDTIEQDETHNIINPVEDFEVLTWRFVVPRRTRVPKGWYVVCMAIEQDDHYLPVYTLISPEDFENLPMAQSFKPLPNKRDQADGENLRLAGQNRRLLKAEGARNMHGAEMLPENFETFINWLNSNYSEQLSAR